MVTLIQMKIEKAQIHKIMNKKGEITTNTKEVETIVINHYQQLNEYKLSNQMKWMHSWKTINSEIAPGRN